MGKNLVLKAILDGLYDEESQLSNLRGLHHILKYIWTDLRNYWQSHITHPDPTAQWNALLHKMKLSENVPKPFI